MEEERRFDAGHKMTDDMRQTLQKIPLLARLSEQQLNCLADAEELHLVEGEYVARQGETARFFYFLISGELKVEQTLADGHQLALSTLEPGMTFGEVPLLANLPNAASVIVKTSSHLVRVDVQSFWALMTQCPQVRIAILGDMATRLQGLQSISLQQEKMATLGTLAAGLMHELNNPGTAARRAAAQLRENLMRMHELTAKFTRTTLSQEQKQCMLTLQEHALAVKRPLMMNSLEQSDAEEALVEWLEAAAVENAWKLAPTLVAIGMDAGELECAKSEFAGPVFSDALSWLEALVSCMQLVTTIEESIGRVGDLVKAVKSYSYEGKGDRQEVDVNASIHATLVVLWHKVREKQIALEKDLSADLPMVQTDCSGLNQVWTNLLDNAIDAVPQGGRIKVRTWMERAQGDGPSEVCISVADNGAGIPLESQPHIFEPFYTTKPVGVGTGLGLGIVHRIVKQYGGTIRFSSDEHGTEFQVRVPARLPARPEAQMSPSLA